MQTIKNVGVAAMLVLVIGLVAVWAAPALMASQTSTVQYELVSVLQEGVDDPAGGMVIDQGRVVDVASGDDIGAYIMELRSFSLNNPTAPNAATSRITIIFDGIEVTEGPANLTFLGAHSFESGNQEGSLAAGGRVFGFTPNGAYLLNGASSVMTISTDF